MKETIKNYIEKLDRYSLFNLTEIPGLDPEKAVPEMIDLTKLTASKKILVTRKGNLYKVSGKNPEWVSAYNYAVDYGSKFNSSIKTVYGKLNALLSNLPGGACITIDAVAEVTGLASSRELIQKELNKIVKKDIFEKVDTLANGSVIYQKIDKNGAKFKRGVDELIEFLKDSGTYEAFEKNFKVQRTSTESKDIRKTLVNRRTLPEMLLSTAAFWWQDTPEGANYWSELDRQYREHLFSIHRDELSSSQILEAFKKAVPEDPVAYSHFLDNLIHEHWSLD